MPVKKPPAKRVKKNVAVDSIAIFEKILKKAATHWHYQLRLYIAGTTPRSSQAIANIRSLCEEFLPGRYDLEIVDIYQQPLTAANKQIIAAPTLVRELPSPPRRVVGDLSDRNKILVSLNLTAKQEANP